MWSLIFTAVKLSLTFRKNSNRYFLSDFAQIILLTTSFLSYIPHKLCWCKSTPLYWHKGARMFQWQIFRNAELWYWVQHFTEMSQLEHMKIEPSKITVILQKSRLHITRCRQSHQALTWILFSSYSSNSNTAVGKIIPFVFKRKIPLKPMN